MVSFLIIYLLDYSCVDCSDSYWFLLGGKVESTSSRQCTLVLPKNALFSHNCLFILQKCHFVSWNCPFVFQKSLFISLKCPVVFQNYPLVFLKYFLFIYCVCLFSRMLFSSWLHLLLVLLRTANLWCLLDNSKTSTWGMIFYVFYPNFNLHDSL